MAVLSTDERRVLNLVAKKEGLTPEQVSRKLALKAPPASTNGGGMVPLVGPIDRLVAIGLLSGDQHLRTTDDGATSSQFYLAFQRLRLMIGVAMIMLPIFLVIGNLVVGTGGVQGSISAYYYTPMRNWFVGTLFAIAGALLAYKDCPGDDIWTRAACLAAVGVAVFPTTQGDPRTAVGWIHLFWTFTLFGLLAVTCFVSFVKPDPAKGSAYPTDKQLEAKRRRNRWYRIYGMIIVLCAVLLVVFVLLNTPTLSLEFAGLAVIGIAWIAKSNWMIEHVGIFRRFR